MTDPGLLGRSWDRLTFVGRLLLISSAALIVAGAAMLLVSARQESREIQQDLQAELSRELAAFPTALDDFVVIGDYSTLEQILNAYALRPSIVRVAFTDVSGATISGASRDPRTSAPAWFLRLFRYESYEGSQTLTVGGRRYGEVFLKLTANPRAELAWVRFESHISILLLAILIDFAGIWMVLRNGLAPLQLLKKGAASLARGEAVYVVPAGSPEIRSVIGAFNDMAESLREGTAALRKSEERLSYVLGATQDAIWDWDIPGDAVVHNAQWASLLGLNNVPVPHSAAFHVALVHPDDRERVRQALHDAQQGDGQYVAEYRFLRGDGRVVWVLDRGKVVERDEAGQARRMVGAASDITRRKDDELSIGRERQRLADIVEGTDAGTWEWNSQTATVSFNDRGADMLGYGPGELGTLSVDAWLALIHPDDRGEVAALLERHFQSQDALFRVETRVRRKDGDWLPVLDLGKVVSRTAEGKPLLMAGARFDISARKKVEQALQQASESAQSANRAKSLFLAAMSHEIRTPMNGILGMAQLLSQAQVSDDERHRFTQAILSSGNALLQVLDDLIDISRVEAGALSLQPVEFDPGQLIDEVRTLFSNTALVKNLDIACTWTGAPGQRYVGDVGRVRQMINNLLHNALKFTAQGGVTLVVRETRRAGDAATLEFSVSDTGIGIPSDKLPLLFVPFSQVNEGPARLFGGSGLGLSITRRLAQLMGGDIHVESESGKGSRFVFHIQVGIAAQPAQAPAALGSASEWNWSGKGLAAVSGRVLIVDDNAINRMVMGAMLGRLGLETVEVSDGQQAFDTVASGQSFDLVLMDLQMPGMHGFDATALIRNWEKEHPGRRRLPVVAISADAYPQEQAQAYVQGLDEFLAKPVKMRELHACLLRWLPAGPGPTALATATSAPAAPITP